MLRGHIGADQGTETTSPGSTNRQETRKNYNLLRKGLTF